MKMITATLLIFVFCGCTQKNTVSKKTETKNDSIELRNLKVDDVKTANDAFNSVSK